MNSFLFIIPRVPAHLRNELRAQLYDITLKSLFAQKSKKWKAIILGEKENNIENDHLIYIEADNFTKVEKLAKALDYISTHPEIKPDYIIRLDADDLISETFLYDIENLPQDYDLYYDPSHVCIDPVYMKMSYRKNNWVANTAIHKYEYAITPCGPLNEVLFLQDHDLYWLQFYNDKKIYKSSRTAPLYYRILTPFSITSQNGLNETQVDWLKYTSYLNSYGPWITLKNTFYFYTELEKINLLFFSEKPHKDKSYWLFNYIKHYKNIWYSDRLGKNRPETILNNGIPQHYHECSRCLLTTRDTVNIFFDDERVCNYCRYYDSVVKKLGNSNSKKNWLLNKIQQIKKEGAGKEFDCILGVSGGVDSTYLSYWAKENGLKPLVVHYDNGWNTELATSNIKNICEKLGFSLCTYVINWEEFKDMQVAYLRAGVIDMEALTDHAIIATIYKIAVRYKIKYTLSGFNYATEAIMPKGWVFDKSDWENIKDIYSKFGSGKKLDTYPHINFPKKLFYHWFLKLESIQVLNYIDYSKEEAKKVIAERVAWKDYGGKHYESIFTKFYQAYILPRRFGIDKRKAHLSNLICSGQMSKAEAKLELEKSLYTEADLKNEKEYILKKLSLSNDEFEKIMAGPKRSHEEFTTEKRLWSHYFKLINILKFKFKKSESGK